MCIVYTCERERERETCDAYGGSCGTLIHEQRMLMASTLREVVRMARTNKQLDGSPRGFVSPLTDLEALAAEIMEKGGRLGEDEQVAIDTKRAKKLG